MNLNGNNVRSEIKGTKLLIEIDVAKGVVDAAKPSKTGKKKLVANTPGFVPVGNDLKLSLNLIV